LRIYGLSVALLRGLLALFFRRVEVTGLGNVPATGGGIFIAWHPNALVDGALIVTAFPRRIVVGARHGLFRWPVLGAALRAMGAVPVYRRRDFPEDADGARRREGNEKSIDAMARAVAQGAFALLFPEGESHDAPYLIELKTGAARLYYRSCERTDAGAVPPVIVPVGLHYDRKHLFRSSALVSFHPPIDLKPELAAIPASATEEERRATYRALTDELERSLREVVYATESWDLHHAMHRARKLMRAEGAHRAGASLERPGMKERIRWFSRLWAGYNERARTHPEEVEDLVARIRSYDSDLRALGIEDHELYGGGLPSTRLVARIAFQVLLVYFVLPPLLLIGYVVNLPAGLMVWGVSKWGASARKDVASLKLVAGAIAFPAVWLAAAFLVAWGWTRLAQLYPRFSGAPFATGVLAFSMSALGALVALHYQRLARQTLRAARVRLTRWRRSTTLERLRAQRSQLYDELMRLAEGLELSRE
jgi:1-acyl-sn-glycerol-3-phosphate acyltransferase